MTRLIHMRANVGLPLLAAKADTPEMAVTRRTTGRTGWSTRMHIRRRVQQRHGEVHVAANDLSDTNRRRHASPLMLLALLIALVGCIPKNLPPKPIPHDTTLQDELFAADRAFSRAVVDSGAPAWNARLAPDVTKPGAGGLILLRGVEPVSAFDKSLFADPTRQLRWEPTDAVAYTDGRTGVTVGRSAWVRKTAPTDTLARGRYLTLWRKQPDGRWLILLDTGWPDQ
jgi:ketosteroid isomerase-like protein